MRDGEQALRLAQEVVKSQGSLDHVETLAMALAEQACRRLEFYESVSPCHAPLLGG